ncbi:MAG TPA: alpha/beta fold hydrolase [Steroidobacteraceae bacterium]|nr:alpha/beta fold hydrolase [Steroidobacteraceae bacterium]
MRRIPRQERTTIPGCAGGLETLVEEPAGESTDEPRLFGVVCHPHPLFGGTLENKVVHTLARGLHELGLPTLRFNFRGVGASAGSFADGIGETEDALAVVAWGRARWPGAEPWLLGFSFGGAVAIRAAASAPARCLVTVAPAVERVATAAAMPTCPWLVIQGDADEVIAPRSVLEWVARHAPDAVVRVLAGAGHYFHGRLPELREAVVGFARELGEP